MNQSDHINELATALCKCQMQLQPAIKDSSNPFFKSKYADLSSVQAACREPLANNGLCVIQTINRSEEGEPILTTTLAHTSGQWIRSTCPIPIKEEVGPIDPKKKAYKNDPQALGSSITYMRRYSLSSIVGISTEDDDGEAAMLRDKNKKSSSDKSSDDPIISKENADILKKLAEKCDPEYMTNIYNHIKTKGCNGFDDLKSSLYNIILKGMLKNASENSSQQMVS